MAGADGSADLFDVLMIDEVAAPLTPLQYLASDTPLHITKQTATHVGQINATLSLLESASQATQLHQLLWKADGITLRVTAVTKGTGSLIYHDTKEQIQFKHEISDEMLMNLARSIAPGAHCG